MGCWCVWLTFFEAVAVLVAIMYVPGALLGKGLGFAFSETVASAPLLTTALLSLVGILLGALGVSGPVALPLLLACVFGACALVFLVAWVARKKARATNGSIGAVVAEPVSSQAALLLLYLLVSALVTGLIFLMALDGPASFSQQVDNSAHLALISEIAGDGNYSVLKTTHYPLGLVADGVAPMDSVGFYPNAFHVFASLVVSLFGASAPFGENVALFVFVAVVYASSFFGLMQRLWGRDKTLMLSGSLAVVSFAAFPLGMMWFGPIYPNVTAFCAVPAAAVLFMRLFEQRDRAGRAMGLVCFVLGCWGLVALQPNASFTLAVFMAPFCGQRLHRFLLEKHPDSPRRATVGVLAFGAFVIALWMLIYQAPFMRGVVSFSWPALSSTVLDGVGNAVLLGFRLGIPQVLLAFLVFVGLVRALSHPGYAWMGISFLVMMTLYFVGNTFDGEIKNILTGFWYTDQWRTSACCAIIGAPLAALGIDTCSFGVSRLLSEGYGRRVSQIALGCVVAASIGLLLMSPWEDAARDGRVAGTSAFSAIASDLREENRLSEDKVYTPEERDFVKRASEVVGDSLVVNMPFDGSVWAYLDGSINAYYRSYSQSGETGDSVLIRTRLSHLDEDEELRDELRSIGASYVLQLELNGYNDDEVHPWSLHGEYNASDWVGFTEGLDNVSSLEPVLSEGDMRLYRIVL